MPKVSVGRAELDTRPHFLYRFYDRTGVLLYIGITVNFEEREKQHAGSKEWWARVDRNSTRVEYYLGRRAVLEAERAAIKAEKPLENDQHNDFVEVDEVAEPVDEALALADEILGDMEEDFRDELLESCATDWQNEPLNDRQRHIAAAGLAAFRIRMLHRDLLYNIEQMLDLLPHERGQNYRDVVEGQSSAGSGDGAAWWDMKFIPAVVSLWLIDEASMQLDAMSDEEAREWRATIKSKSVGPTQRTILAARHASIWKQYGTTFAGNCIGPGRHGALCTNKVDVWVHYEICGPCKPEPECMGHDHWCLEHAKSAQRGDLALLCDDKHGRILLPIGQVRPMNANPIEPVF